MHNPLSDYVHMGSDSESRVCFKASLINMFDVNTGSNGINAQRINSSKVHLLFEELTFLGLRTGDTGRIQR